MRLLLLFIFLYPFASLAQQSQIDSLSAALSKSSSDSAKVILHCALSKQYALSDVPKATQHAKAAEKVATKINSLSGLATALNQQGHLHLVLGEFDKSLALFYRALTLGLKAKDTTQLLVTYTKLGVLNKKTKDQKRALENYAIAENLAKKAKDNLALSKVYNNIGSLHADNTEYKKALKYFYKSAEIPNALSDKQSYAITLQNIGEMYIKLNQPATAREYLFKAAKLDAEVQNKMNMPVTFGTLAQSYLAEQNYKEALVYALKSMDIATQTGSSKKISASAKLLQSIYEEQQNFTQAYKYQSLYLEHQDKLDAESQNRAAAEITARYENDKRDLETQKLRAEKESQLVKIEHQRVVLGLCITFLVLAFMVLVELVLRRKHLKAANNELKNVSHQLKNQNEEIIRQKEEIQLQAIALQKQNELLEKHNHFKSKVFSIVSHDLRSPFTTIQGVLQLGQGNLMSEQDMKRIFGLLSKDVDVVLEMLNNILVWSGNQMEEDALQIKPISAFDLVEDCLQLVTDKAEQKNILFENQIEQNAAVLADRERLAFVFRNLLMNAVKFSYPGDKVTLKAQEENGALVIKVSDTGKGISERNLAKLFTKVRFTTLGTSQEVGTGLGLMLCKELLESMGGTISVESVEGKGTTFSVVLPKAALMVAHKEDSELACA
ncbi:tetratricopeptide repeat-containing sensor histidine kinase [Rufibacter roseus]|uniref:histidine kinase n=1 Tax=Rufibacter roseus TaxID=1567108 RepID=A0ABW2DM35_9BACT|nr:ATP-binding protein [Rufibacter roseus]